jgi:uncharacterized protein (TIGR00730 family)
MTDIRSLCVYCGSSDLGPPSHRLAAAKLGEILAKEGVELVFGGGRVGLMGVIADSTLSNGGRVTGIIPDHLIRAEVGHGNVSELIVVDSMHVRKETMFQRSDAFAILPGGPGTLDETFEILTWKQLRLHDKPVVVVNIDGYWGPLEELLDHMIAQGFAQPAHRKLFTVVTRIEDVLPALALQPEPMIEPETKWL